MRQSGLRRFHGRETDVYVRYLDGVAANPFNQALKGRTFASLNLSLGDCVLDVGCGTGDDTRTLWRQVRPTGRVVGVDVSEKLIEVARRRSEHLAEPVEFVVGDIYSLHLPDATFDGCRVERVFVHPADAERAMAELVRVTKPGGRIVVIDGDWETLVVWPASRELTRRIPHCLDATVPNWWAGRRLRPLFVNAGLADIRVEAGTFTAHEFERAVNNMPLSDFADRAVAAGVVTQAEH